MIEFKELIGTTGYAVETVGVVVIILGSIISSFRFLRDLRRTSTAAAYREFQRDLSF